MEQIAYVPFKNSDFGQLLVMGQKLWKDLDKAELESLLKQAAQSQKYTILMAKNPEGNCIGFSIFSIRTDYVEGAKKTPTGYLEGIFVVVEYRKMGIAKEFLRIGELWCK